jgi:hypothetical protein
MCPTCFVCASRPFSTPQRNTGIAMVIATSNFAGTPAVTVTMVLAMFLTLSGLVMQFVLHKLRRETRRGVGTTGYECRSTQDYQLEATDLLNRDMAAHSDQLTLNGQLLLKGFAQRNFP